MTYVMIILLGILVWLIFTGRLAPQRRVPMEERPKPVGVVAGAFWEASRPSMATQAADAAIKAYADEARAELAPEVSLAEAYDERWKWERKHEDILAELPDEIREALAPTVKDTPRLSAATVHDTMTAPQHMVATTVVDHAGNHVRTDWTPQRRT